MSTESKSLPVAVVSSGWGVASLDLIFADKVVESVKLPPGNCLIVGLGCRFVGTAKEHGAAAGSGRRSGLGLLEHVTAALMVEVIVNHLIMSYINWADQVK